MESSVSEQLRHGRMSLFQIRAVAICLTIHMLDGFDILVIAFLAPEIARQWSLSPEELGVLFSAGLAGMTFGSLFLSPLADVYGRRPVILLSLVVTSTGMILSAFTEDLTGLVAVRVLTGLGIGTVLASLATIVAEYASDRRRAAAVSVSMAGLPIGGILGGVITVYLLEHFDWQTVFIFGGLMTGLMIPLALAFLPESVDYMLTRPAPDTLGRINKLMLKMGKSTVTEVPMVDSKSVSVVTRVAGLFQPTLRRQTMLIWCCFFLTMSSLYFAQTWTPKIMVDAGFEVSEGVSIGILIQLGALVGIAMIGVLTVRLSIYATAAALMVVGFLSMVVFSFNLVNIDIVYVLAICIGLGINAGVVALYAIVPDIYPAEVRTTALGWAIGIGRSSAVLAPAIAGYLLGVGTELTVVYFGFAAPMLLAAIAVLATKPDKKKEERRKINGPFI